MMNCDQANNLMLECLTGTMPPDGRRALQAHLNTCASCRRRAQEMEETVGLLRTVPEPHLPEAHWPQFMAALDRRLDRETTGWRRFVRWVRTPRIAWSTAAATSAMVVALGIALLVQPASEFERASVEDPSAYLRGLVTDNIVQAMPSMSTALTSWKAGLDASEVPYEFPPIGGE